MAPESKQDIGKTLLNKTNRFGQPVLSITVVILSNPLYLVNKD